MKQSYTIGLYLDTRRAKDDGTFPVKIRAYDATLQNKKLFPTSLSLSAEDYKRAWQTERPRREYKELRQTLNALEAKAVESAKKLSPFTFDGFEKALYRKKGDGIRVAYRIEEVVEALRKEGRMNTAASYENTGNSLKEFTDTSTRQKYDGLTLLDISPSWLSKYEKWMTESRGRSLTTVSIYLRSLRVVFNKAISEGEIDRSFYPFGKGSDLYEIANPGRVKKALSQSQLRALFEAAPSTPEQERAKAFWFFSYMCSGMNLKDIALLKYKDIRDGKVVFYRAKTIRTTRSNLEPVEVYLNRYALNVIKEFGARPADPSKYVFNILSPGMSDKDIYMSIKNFTRSINQHIKNLAEPIGLGRDISFQWARHSYATNSIRNGASMEFVQESLGHKDLRTTQNYFKGFTNEVRKEFADKLMDF